MEWVKEWAGHLVVYFVILSAVMNFLPEGEEKKQVKFYMGVLLLLFLMKPLIVMGDLEDFFMKRMDFHVFEQEYDQMKKEAEVLEDDGEEYIRMAVRKEWEDQICTDVEKCGWKILSCVITYERENHMTPEKIRLVVKAAEETADIKNVKRELEHVYKFLPENINIRMQE